MISRALRILSCLLILCTACLLAGCAPDTEPIERTASKGFDVVQTALSKAVAETSTRTASLQGTLTGVEPGWVFEGYGIWGTGIVYQGKMYMKGVSGTLMGHTQTDAGQEGSVPPPAMREPDAAPE